MLRVARVLLGVLLVAFTPRTSWSAGLRWSAPPECDAEIALRQEIERLIGGSLDAVEGVDFEVSATPGSDGSWQLAIRTVEDDASRIRTRELTARSCAELAELGAVAIALAAQSVKAEKAAAPPRNAPAELTRETLRPAPRRDASVRPRTRRPVPIDDRSARVHDIPGLDVDLGLGVIAESGALPSPAPGALAELGAGWRALYGSAYAALFVPRRADLPSGEGGDFRLMVGGILTCIRRDVGLVRVLGCGGYELGVLEGEGTGVQQPELASYVWHAMYVGAGGLVHVSESVGIALRLGVAAPFERRGFTVNGADFVYRPSGLSWRGSLGLQVPL